MFNEIWPAPTWGSVDYIGRYKFLHYTARRFYAPLMVNAYEINNSTFRVMLTSDINSDLGSLTVEIRTFLYNTRSPLHMISKEVKMGPLDNLLVYETNNLVGDVLLGKNRSECVVSLRLVGHPYVHNEFYPSLWKDIKTLQRSDIKIMNMTKSMNNFEFVVWSEYVAPFVFIEIDEEIFGLFDDNAFTLWPGEQKRVRFECRRGKCDVSVTEFEKLLILNTLSKTY
jgi:beta-mannosidase